jgi:hypothetical protein
MKRTNGLKRSQERGSNASSAARQLALYIVALTIIACGIGFMMLALSWLKARPPHPAVPAATSSTSRPGVSATTPAHADVTGRPSTTAAQPASATPAGGTAPSSPPAITPVDSAATAHPARSSNAVAVTPPVRLDATPRIKAQDEGAGDTAAVAADPPDGAVISIASQRGIGHVTLQPDHGNWPSPLVVRLSLRGLESLEIHAGATLLEAQISTHGDHAQLLQLTAPGKPPAAIKPGDALWMKIDACDAQGKSVNGLPPAGGYFKMTLPPALLKDQPKNVAINWVDFYR